VQTDMEKDIDLDMGIGVKSVSGLERSINEQIFLASKVILVVACIYRADTS
jgi:hypothetical protein